MSGPFLIHTYVTHLNFSIYKCWDDPDSTYSKLVDHVLNSHRGTWIKEFKLSTNAGGNFEKWFEFSLSKKAETIHLSSYHDIDYEGLFLRLPKTNNGFECLRDLQLSNARMTDQDFELLLSNCTALESLKLGYPVELKNVSIVGHTINWSICTCLSSELTPLWSVMLLASFLWRCIAWAVDAPCNLAIHRSLLNSILKMIFFRNCLMSSLLKCHVASANQLQIMFLLIEVDSISEVIINLQFISKFF